MTLLVLAHTAVAPAAEVTTVSFLSYNVHGIFRLAAGDNPRDRMPAIGWLANKYDVVLLQEDFEYPDVIRSQMQGRAAYRGTGISSDPALVLARILMFPLTLPIPRFSPPYGSGLTSYVPKAMDVEAGMLRKAYDDCAGWFRSRADCWAHKGLLRVRVRTPAGAEIDVYNTHIEAGAEGRSMRSRRRNFEVLAQTIAKESSDRAVVVGGDFNVDYSRPQDRDTITAFRQRLGLSDSGAGPELPVWREHDFLLFRSGNGARLSVVETGEAKEFVNGKRALSDHPALFARLSVAPQ
jgi:exonuclease III